MSTPRPTVIRPPKARSPLPAIIVGALVILIVLGGLGVAMLKSRQRRETQIQYQPTELGQGIAEKLAAGAANKYSPLGTTADEILSHENDGMKDDMLGALIWRIDRKIETRGWTNLTQVEQRLVAVSAMDGEVLNGGFDQYFFNPTGEDAEIALAGLEDMGATVSARLLERAMQQFPGGKPTVDTEKRRELMDQIQSTAKPVWNQCDDEYYDRKEDTYTLSLAYAKKNKAQIILP